MFTIIRPRPNYLKVILFVEFIPGSRRCVAFICVWYRCDAVLTVFSHSLIDSAPVDWFGVYLGVRR